MGHTPLPAPTLFGAPPVEKHFLNDLSEFSAEFPPRTAFVEKAPTV
jgi:hypothetical protein